MREIDTINIYHATHLAMRRAIARIGGHDHVLVDGNRIRGFEAAVGPYTAIVDGDSRCYTIACASVVAKVVRDRMMALLAARYPGYGWEHNQGYATRDHRDAIRKLGLTPYHRRSFLALQRTLAGDQISLDLFDEAVETIEQQDALARARSPGRQCRTASRTASRTTERAWSSSSPMPPPPQRSRRPRRSCARSPAGRQVHRAPTRTADLDRWPLDSGPPSASKRDDSKVSGAQLRGMRPRSAP